ncbi:MAG: ABC transporter ATP-binding protein [Candidatus Omnitrophica bacterium]|nr:ABC transporter ATP-binding protein [Candidatus Omnitrophota bacterium]
MENIIEVNNLTVIYKTGRNEKKAVDGLDFAVKKGEIFGFLGPNGAGKTTTIKAILGLLGAAGGNVSIFQKNPAIPASRKLVGYMPEIANYYWYLTPRELLFLFGGIFGITRKTLAGRTDELLKLVDLAEHKNALMKTFSKGMLQRVSFAQSLINDPELLVLDEPTTGLDPISKMNMRDTIVRLKNEGKTVFFSSHELSEVEIISDRVIILKDGKLLKEARPKEIMDEKGSHVTLEKYFFELVKK